MISLQAPHTRWHRSLLDFLDGYGADHIDGLSRADGDVDALADPQVYAAWVREQLDHEAGRNVPAGRVACTSRWIVRDGVIVGTINLRHSLNDMLLEYGGHIGYAVHPRARGRGIATRALRLMLAEAAHLGINPVLITCHDTNLASAQVILKAGGVLQDVRNGFRRHWITRPGTPIGYAAHPLGEAPLYGLAVTLPVITPSVAEAIGRAGRGGPVAPDWAPGFPRQDDIDATRALPLAGPATPWGSRLVVRRRDGLVVGTVGCYGPPDARDVVEIGYGLVESARRQGLMTDALRLLVPAIEATGAGVCAHTAAENVGSRALLVRLGFRETGQRNADGELRYQRPAPAPAGA